uniref:peptidylprolyl isomerase n=1 Tax=Anolis carolinensis TaxID=28377 RepID=G1KV70_ANOCA
MLSRRRRRRACGTESQLPPKERCCPLLIHGKLEDGTFFDSNIQTSSKKMKAAKPLSFKVGVGKVICGWDEALLTMSKGDKAHLEIELEWVYGKKGQPDAKIPPNAKLLFEVKLVNIECASPGPQLMVRNPLSPEKKTNVALYTYLYIAIGGGA